MIHTVLTSVWAVFITALLAPTAIAASFVGQGGNLAHLVGRLWARSILLVGRVKVFVRGLEHIDPRVPYVYMANHQSMFDILVLLGYLPIQFRWLAKRELFQIPVFGYSMARVGYISIDRSNRKAAHKSLQRAAEKIAQGVSVVIFPEGSRSADGQVQPFKMGGFHLAMRSRRPIIPVVIYGTFQVMPKGRLRIRPGRIIVHIHRPVDTASHNSKTKHILTQSVYSIMKQDLEKIAATQAHEQT